jgi:hypothetical protein
MVGPAERGSETPPFFQVTIRDLGAHILEIKGPVYKDVANETTQGLRKLT